MTHASLPYCPSPSDCPCLASLSLLALPTPCPFILHPQPYCPLPYLCILPQCPVSSPNFSLLLVIRVFLNLSRRFSVPLSTLFCVSVILGLFVYLYSVPLTRISASPLSCLSLYRHCSSFVLYRVPVSFLYIVAVSLCPPSHPLPSLSSPSTPFSVHGFVYSLFTLYRSSFSSPGLGLSWSTLIQYSVFHFVYSCLRW